MALKIGRVLISDKVATCCNEVFLKQNILVDYKPGLSKEELKSIIKDYDALIVRSATKVTADVFECATNLKIVGRAGTGVDNIDLTAASKHGVLVMNTPGGNTLSAAEHTCALISGLARHIGQGYASLLAGKWERSKFMGSELNGKVLGVVGLGRIGREVAHRMRSYGMRTVGYDPIIPKKVAESFGVEFMSLEEMWPVVDFVTVHVPLLPSTKGMINKNVFELCKPTVRVINVARGGIIDEHDLLEALNNNKCGGAALDVFLAEPPKDISLEVIQHPKVLSTPHLGASTSEAQTRVAKEIAEQIVDGMNGKALVGLVNAPALSQLGNPEFQPWVKAAEKLGKLTGKLYTDTRDFKVTVTGTLQEAEKLMCAAFSCGIAQSKKRKTNYINAISLLNEMNIKVNVSLDSSITVSSLSLKINDETALAVMLTSESAVLTNVSGLSLKTPISLEENLIIGSSQSQSLKQLLQLLNGIEITSFSGAMTGKLSVVVATIDGMLEEALPSPLVFFEL